MALHATHGDQPGGHADPASPIYWRALQAAPVQGRTGPSPGTDNAQGHPRAATAAARHAPGFASHEVDRPKAAGRAFMTGRCAGPA
jgi:hypothetical protein